MDTVEKLCRGEMTEFCLEVSGKASWRRLREMTKHLTSEHDCVGWGEEEKAFRTRGKWQHRARITWESVSNSRLFSVAEMTCEEVSNKI